MSATFREAVDLARWYTAYALDLAPDAHPHPGVIGHLTAAQAQHWAVEQLMKTSGPERAAA